MLEFTWQSFAFAVVNFLILVGLLYKLLHKPLLRVLAQRREAIETAHKTAEREVEKAKEMQKEYESKLTAADEERHSLLVETRSEAEAASRKLLDEATSEAERELARLKTGYEQEQREALAEFRGDIVAAGVEAAKRVLETVAGQDLDARLNAQLVKALEQLAADTGNRAAPGDGEPPVRVASARDLSPSDREAVENAVRNVAGERVEIVFEADPELVAGTRVEFSTATVDSTLSDVLAGIARDVDKAAEVPEEETAS